MIVLVLIISETSGSDFTFSPINTTHGLTDNQIRYILQLPDGRMVFTTSGNVNIYDGFYFKYIHRSDEDIINLDRYDGHYRIYQSKDSLLWIKDHYKLMSIDLRKEQYVKNPDSIFRGKGIQDKVHDLFIDHDKRMWLLTDKGLIQPESSLLIYNVGKKGKLQDIASDGNHLYLFYHTGKISCYDLSTQKELYSVSPYPEDEVPMFDRTSLVVKGNDGLYQLRNGTKAGLFYFNPKTKSWKTLLETDYTLNTLVITPDEKAYISCAKGIWIVDPEMETKKYHPSLKVIDGNPVTTQVSTLFYDRQGGLWIGTFNRGLLYYHPSRYTFKRINASYFRQPLQENVEVQRFAESIDGKIYLKASSEFYLYHSSAEDSVYLTSVPPQSLPKEVADQLRLFFDQPTYRNKTYTALCKDSRGWVWGGTADGLELFTSPNDKAQTFYVENGLVNNFIHSIIEDRKKQIWITTSNGISKIKVDPITANIHFTNYSTYDGTLSGEYLNNAAFESSDGALYFGGIDGFNVLSPNGLSVPQLPFRPILRTIRIHGEEIIPDKFYGNRIILPQVSPFTNGITLDYHQNFLTFEFSSLNYIDPGKTLYRYQLKGIDQNWVIVKPGTTNEGILSISYTDLSPGEYTLQVMATNKAGVWDGPVSTFSITILPPWWKTTTAYFLYALSIILVVAGALYLYTRYTKQKLEQQHREEILLLRIRNLIEQRNTFEDAQKEKKGFKEEASDEPGQKPADFAFLNKAMELVEKNLGVPDYSVEQLSRDLYMDRTGLYRKLTNLLEESPSLFIRNIRLKRAEQLILEGNLTIAEIADRVGFSSSSYLSKCFREVYGCSPSKYPDLVKKST